MIDAQREVLDVCTKLYEAAKAGDVAEAKRVEIESWEKEVERQELVVPVIGEFSAGKSTMINTLLGSDSAVLPVNVTPETSLATELHYTSGSEYAEGIDASGNTTRYEISEMNRLAKDATKYNYAKAYLNNEKLRTIEPLVLVDMPGFSSPIAQHNNAILTYLNKGCYYIVLSSVQEGTVSSTLKRRLNEIDKNGREFSLFLSKANLKSTGELDKLKSYYRDFLQDNFDMTGDVEALDNTSSESVLKCLKSIQTDKLFKWIFYEAMSGFCQDIITAINLQIRASERSEEEINSLKNALSESITKLRERAENDIRNMKMQYSQRMVNDIILEVGSALDNSLGELVSLAMSGEQSKIERTINDVVRSALVPAVQSKIGEVNEQIVMDFSDSVKNLDTVFKTLNIDDNFIKTLSDGLHLVFDMANKPIDPMVNASSVFGSIASSKALSLGTTAGALAVVASPIPGGPIIGTILALLPTLLNFFFGGGEQNNAAAQESQVRSKFTGEVFPGIKSKLRPELPSVLQEQIGQMIEAVREQYEEKIKLQQAEIDKAVEEKKKEAASIKEKHEQLQKVRENVQSLATQISTWK